MKNIQSMKCKTNGFSAFALPLAVCCLFLLLLSGCPNSLNLPEITGNNQGTFSLTIGRQTVGRTIMPDVSMDDFAAFSLYFTPSPECNADNEEFTVDWDGNRQGTVTLNPGIWDLQVTAYLTDNTEGDGAKAAEGRLLGIAVPSGGNVQGMVTLLPIATGQGTFNWNLELPEDTASARLEILRLNEDGSLCPQTNPRVITFDDGATWTGEDGIPLPAGSYRIVLTLLDEDGQEVVMSAILRIYQNMESIFKDDFSGAVFGVLHLFITFDRGWATEGTAPSTMIVPVDSEITIPGQGSLARTYHIFTGWNTQADGSGTSHAVDSRYTVTEDLTLFAQWQVVLTRIYISPANPMVVAGGTVQLEAAPFPTNAPLGAVTWESDNTSVATVNASGRVTGIARGTATITASYGTINRSVNVTVTKQPVSAGSAHSLQVRADGTLWAWGDNFAGQTGLGWWLVGRAFSAILVPTQVGTASNWTSVSAGGSHNLAIRADGTLWAWGRNANGRTGLGTDTGYTLVPTQVGQSNDWAFVSTGDAHSLAIRTDGTLWAWGHNASGRTGLNTTTGDTLVPNRVGTESDWLYVSAGASHSLGIRAEGTLRALWTWGNNANARTGRNTIVGNTLVPTRISLTAAGGIPVNDWVSVSAGEAHSLATRADGTLRAWGYNADGRIGHTAGVEARIPQQVGTARNWASVSAGDQHSLAIRADGTLWAWGSNYFGRTGLGTTTGNTVSPHRVGTESNWVYASASGAFSIAIKEDGTLWAWGHNYFGRTGSGTPFGNTLTPIRIDTAVNLPQFSAGRTHNLEVRADGTLWAWGTSTQTSLGFSTDTPTRVGTASNWAFVSAGDLHSLAIRTDGTLWAWGINQNGRTGLGTDTGHASAPTRVGTASNWAFVSAGRQYSLGVRTDGTLWAWGNNNAGQLGLGSGTASTFVPTRVGTESDWVYVSAGDEHSLAIKADGTLWAWGHNGFGRTGLGRTDVSATGTPTRVGTHSDWISVSAGREHSLGIRNDNATWSIWAWGNNANGRTGVATTGATANPREINEPFFFGRGAVFSVSAGDEHSFAIRTNGSLFTWGSNANGRTGQNTPTGNTTSPRQVGTATDWVSVSAGSEHSLAIRTDGTIWAWGNNANGRTGLGMDTGNTLVPTLVPATP